MDAAAILRLQKPVLAQGDEQRLKHRFGALAVKQDIVRERLIDARADMGAERLLQRRVAQRQPALDAEGRELGKQVERLRHDASTFKRHLR